jgi:hypothetical protein
MIASPEMFEATQHLEVLTDPAYCGSKQSEFDHRPLALRFVVQFSTSASAFDNNTPSPMIRFKYNPAFADEYCTQLQHSLSIVVRIHIAYQHTSLPCQFTAMLESKYRETLTQKDSNSCDNSFYEVINVTSQANPTSNPRDDIRAWENLTH